MLVNNLSASSDGLHHRLQACLRQTAIRLHSRTAANAASILVNYMVNSRAAAHNRTTTRTLKRVKHSTIAEAVHRDGVHSQRPVW
ncbi:hypothetical protein RPD_1654 [Rhodopseudomonas palustris BisB5]|uniref:Uncharacterized protein n=1 Tax=Rhodopseudomonas palustris (strain BisB5) TaxID=316057 RepID=Q13AJ8_RHOPS|nr:hypothetical protein RPD_1654 [Rhodopseudomonas palustris BisB5]